MDESEECPRKERSSDTMKQLKQLVSLALISALCLSPSTLMLASDKKKNSDVDEIGNRDINKGNWNMMSIEKEIALGKQLAQDIERQVKLIDDPEINEFVSRVGQNLVRNSDAKVPFTIKVRSEERRVGKEDKT